MSLICSRLKISRAKYGDHPNRCLSLWEDEKTLTEALEVAKDIIVPLDVMNSLWPCPGQRQSFST